MESERLDAAMTLAHKSRREAGGTTVSGSIGMSHHRYPEELAAARAALDEYARRHQLRIDTIDEPCGEPLVEVS